MNKFSSPLSAAFLMLLISLPAIAETDSLPKWELGVAGAVLSIPHYIGSDQRHTLPIGAPFLIYRGDFLKSDREGVRGELFRSNDFSVDIGVSFGLPVESNNNAREGMPDLHLSGQIGPRINWTAHTFDSGAKLSLHLPMRYARDIKNNNLGWVAEPTLRLDNRHLGNKGNISARMDTGLLYAGQAYHRYFYDVATEYATQSRPAYASESGLNHYFIHLSSAYHLTKKFNIGGFARWKSLRSGAVADSPLVTDDVYFAAGVGISWIFKSSE